MGTKILVCVLCSQDFTRGYSANRHNQNLHHGQAKIVRMIDYVIGRIAGEYNPENPLAYRSSYKQQGVWPRNKEHASDQQPNTNSVQPPITPISEFITRSEEFQELARTLYGPEKAKTLLKELYIAIIEDGGKKEVLDRCLEELKNKANMKEAYHRLFSAPIKEDNKRPPLHGHDVQNLEESSRVKLAQIEQLQKIRLKNDVAVHEEIKRIIKVLNSSRRHEILDLELDRLTRNTTNK